MSLCIETAYLVLKNVRQALLPHHHVTTPLCQLIYISLQNLKNEVAPPSAVSPQRARPLLAGSLHKPRGREDLHREASLNLISLVHYCVPFVLWVTRGQLSDCLFLCVCCKGELDMDQNMAQPAAAGFFHVWQQYFSSHCTTPRSGW